MFFIGVRRKEEDAALMARVAKHCKQFSLRAPEVMEVARRTVSQEQVDNVERALFQMGVNPLRVCGGVMHRELCVPMSEEARRRKKQRIAIVTAGVSIAVGCRAFVWSVRE